MATNNRLQMLVRLAMASNPTKTIDDIVADLSPGICAEEFLYDSFAEMRREGLIEITGNNGNRHAKLTQMGLRVLEFDGKIVAKILEIKDELEKVDAVVEAGG